MAFHSRYWAQPVKNGSRQYDYQKWNEESRQNGAQHIKSDPRVQPKPEEPVDLDQQVQLVCDVGGLFLFLAAHLHSTVPDTSAQTRYRIDFRTVQLDDVWTRTGAPNIDTACTGTTMRDYLRGTNLSHLPDEAVALYDKDALAQSE
jgi:hypothetical protein